MLPSSPTIPVACSNHGSSATASILHKESSDGRRTERDACSGQPAARSSALHPPTGGPSMALASSPDTEALADVVRAFSASQHLRAGTREVLENPVEEHVPGWKQMAELGWLGLHVPEEYGGSGFGLQELAVVVEALGAVPA